LEAALFIKTRRIDETKRMDKMIPLDEPTFQTEIPGTAADCAK